MFVVITAAVGIQAAIETEEHGLIDNWLRHIKDVYRFNAEKLDGLNHVEKLDRLCELNVIEQVIYVCNTTIVQRAWKDNVELSVHGWVYSIENGILRDLETCISSREQLIEKSGQ